MMAPISRKMLIHNATLNRVVRDKFGTETDELVAQLYYVRLESSSEVIVTSDNANLQCTGKMYVDSVRSIPIGVQIEVGNSIVWNGERYRVQRVASYYDDTRLHHLEVLLSDG